MNWSAVSQVCQQQNGSLPIIRTESEDKALTTLRADLGEFVPLGLQSDGTNFSWINGRNLTNYNPWLPSEPSPATNRCTIINNADPYGWSDFSCDEARPGAALCQFELDYG